MTVINNWFGNLLGGTDYGLGKLLHENLVDIGATSGSIRTDRIKFFDYVFPTYPFKTCFIFRMPRSTKQISNEFLKPFVYSLWYSTLATIVVFCLFLKFLFFIECKIFGKSKNNSWHSAWILTISVFCQQGAAFVPKPISGRCTLINMLLMSLLLYNYYTSSIVSSLLSGLPTPFKTITELIESQLDVGLEDISYMRSFFKVSSDTDINRLYKTKVLVNNVPSYVPVIQGMEKVKAGGYAYHTEANSGYSIINTEFEPYQICELGEVNILPAQTLWVFYKKNSEYTKIFAIGYNQMLQSGITKRQQLIWMTRKPVCLANTHLIQVGMQHLLPAFVILGVGAGTALLLLFIEIISIKKQN